MKQGAEFADDAQEALRLAQEEAARAHHPFIGTEHLVVGLMRVEEGIAHQVVTGLGITLEAVRAAVEEAVAGYGSRVVEPPPQTSRVREAVEIAAAEASRMGHTRVNTGHLLLALALEGDGVAAHVLEDLGAPPERLIEHVEAALAVPPSGRGKLAAIHPGRFRDIMASFPSGVVVMTAFGEDGEPRGLTVSAFCAVSLEPPLVLASIDKTSNTLPAVQRAGGFTANILAAGRDALARRMATKLTDKFGGLTWRSPAGQLGGPILYEDTAAYAVCTLRDTIEAGDHWILIGLVTEGGHRHDIAPLVFSRRTYL
jgi:flavin reductase (DIM6/NTAB) family NADH-FMN oxidoreductase RutF